MSGYDQTIKIKVKFQEDTKKFLKFLNSVGKKYKRPTIINYRYLGRGRFNLIVDGGPGGIDALFQELVLNKGLYYYGCTLNNKKDIISNVILPVFRQLIDRRFENSQSRFLRKHILGKSAQTEFVPSNATGRFSYLMEIIYRKWDIGIITNKDYIIEIDGVLNSFLMNKLGYKEGDRSPKFDRLLSSFKKSFLINDMQGVFHDVHKMKTEVYHRLSDIKTKDKLEFISNNLLSYFNYFDEFEASQKIKTIKIRGKRYRRIKYGYEKCVDSNGLPYLNDDGTPIDWVKISSEKDCHDCGVKRGQYHVEGCDAEVCPKCGGQYISFDCGLPTY
jgi:hypothetical protein